MVITANDLRILEKLAAMCRSDAAKRERGGAAWPSQDWLGEALGIRRETVCRRIRALAGAGYIRLYKVAAAGPWLRNVYRLTGAAYALLKAGISALGRRLIPLLSTGARVLTLENQKLSITKTIPGRARNSWSSMRLWITAKARALVRMGLEAHQEPLFPPLPEISEEQRAWEARTREAFIARSRGA